jgi:hypothetical protein
MLFSLQQCSRPPFFRLDLLVIFAVLSAAQLSAQTGFVSFDAPDAGPQGRTEPRSINKGGAVTGLYTDTSGMNHGFVRLASGQITEFDPPGLRYTTPTGINKNGQIVGSAADGPITNLVFHGFSRNRSGQFIQIDIPGATSTFVEAINDSGEIVGFFGDSKGAGHGFLRDSTGKFTIFNAPGPNGIFPNHINENGDVTGAWYDSKTRYHAFIRYASGSFVSFDAPGAGSLSGSGTQGSSINLAGEVAGIVQGNDFTTHGFIRDASGAVTTFDVPGSTNTYANTIDDAGTVVGAWFGGCCAPYQLFTRDSAGNITTLSEPVPGTFPVNVSNGRVVGWYYTEKLHGFVQEY